jgi:tRNA A37 threonylcarbamoyladenosine biosynthesis protein TsaE
VLLERTDQLSALADALDAVIAARAGTVVFVGGEAGAGKTALLRAFCDGRGASARILWAPARGCSLRARSARCSTSPR